MFRRLPILSAFRSGTRKFPTEPRVASGTAELVEAKGSANLRCAQRPLSSTTTTTMAARSSATPVAPSREQARLAKDQLNSSPGVSSLG